MLTLAFVYIPVSLTVLAILTGMILYVGSLVGDCPQNRARAKAVSVTIATGFAAIGAGGVIMIGAVLPVLVDAPLAALMVALGFAALCLGLGFTHAMGTLRASLVPLPETGAPVQA